MATKRPSKKHFQQVYCYMCQPQEPFSKLEDLFHHMKEMHQGRLWP